MTEVYHSMLNKELGRIGTFQGWPGVDNNNIPVRPTSFSLAKAGFYYSGDADDVVCFSCGVHVKDWERHQDPFRVHEARNPDCPFIKGLDSTNSLVMIPQEREYIAILDMLKQAGQVVNSTQRGQGLSPSNLISDTLKALYGENMVPVSRPVRTKPVAEQQPPGSPGKPATPKSSRKSSKLKNGNDRNVKPQNSGNSKRSSSTSDANENSRERPQFHRTPSYAAEYHPHGSELLANRQISTPALDFAHFQESEEARLETFNHWAGFRNVSAREFSQAGFIYIGAPDRVQCVFCNGILRNWNINDIPLYEHKKHFSECPFVREVLSSALSISKPRHPQYSTLPSRRESFEDWPRDTIPSKEDLARAGFFFVGHGDSVKCFHCDGGLRNWETDDDPWKEHARWFPKCGFVKQSKGRAYIDAVLKETNLSEYQTASVDESLTRPKNPQTSSTGHGQGVSSAPSSGRLVEPREVNARMDSEIVKTVLKMDVPAKLIKRAIRNRLSEKGEDFVSSEALLEAVFSLDLSATVEGEDEPETNPEPSGAIGMAENPEPVSSISEPESARLMEENRQLKEQKQCKICMDDDACVAFLPCGHLVCCSSCASSLSNCPICRAKIRGNVRTFMA